MHLYLGLQSLLKVHATSMGCYSECFPLDESTSKFPLLAASQKTLLSHSQRLQHTYFGHSVHFWKRVSHFHSCCLFLVCEGNFFLSLSLSPALFGALLLLNLGRLCKFLLIALLFLSPNGCVQNKSEANLSHKA